MYTNYLFSWLFIFLTGGIEIEPSLTNGCHARSCKEYDDCSIFYDPLIRDLHHAASDDIHVTGDWGPDAFYQNPQNGKEIETLNDLNKVSVTIRVEIQRNIVGYGLSASLSLEDRQKLEEYLVESLKTVDSNLTMSPMSELMNDENGETSEASESMMQQNYKKGT